MILGSACTSTLIFAGLNGTSTGSASRSTSCRVLNIGAILLKGMHRLGDGLVFLLLTGVILTLFFLSGLVVLLISRSLSLLGGLLSLTRLLIGGLLRLVALLRGSLLDLFLGTFTLLRPFRMDGLLNLHGRIGAHQLSRGSLIFIETRTLSNEQTDECGHLKLGDLFHAYR